jgi:hypothetical protein
MAARPNEHHVSPVQYLCLAASSPASAEVSFADFFFLSLRMSAFSIAIGAARSRGNSCLDPFQPEHRREARLDGNA